MKKEYMRPELTVLSLVVEDNTNVTEITAPNGNLFLSKLDDNTLSVADSGNGIFELTQSIFGN